MDYAQLTLLYNSIGMLLAMLLNAYEPCTSFDWDMLKVVTLKEELNREEGQRVVRTLQEAWEIAYRIIKEA